MAFKNFNEYLNEKGKINKPKTEIIPDYDGTQPNKPEKNATQGKNWKMDKPVKDEPKPYKTPISNATNSKSAKGLGELGDEKLVYEPDVEGKKPAKDVAVGPKTKTENFLNETKRMSLAEFTKYISEKNTGETNQFQAIKYVSNLIKNENSCSALICEIHRSGNFGKLIFEMVQHQETFREIVALMGNQDGISCCKKFTRALNEFALLKEEVTAPAHEEEGGSGISDKLSSDLVKALKAAMVAAGLDPEDSEDQKKFATQLKSPPQDQQQPPTDQSQQQPMGGQPPDMGGGQMPPMPTQGGGMQPMEAFNPNYNLIKTMKGYGHLRNLMANA